MLDRGTRGAQECRATLVQYDEKSPLYGFLLYRRRRVLIKYTPDGTSRLLLGTYAAASCKVPREPVQGASLQSAANRPAARVAVHFTAVAEKFAPHDITMTIRSPDELSDAALASACSLHTAAPSSCSSSSSRPRLDEITETSEPIEDPEDIPLARLISARAASSRAASVSGHADPDMPAPLKIHNSPPRALPRESAKPASPLRRVQTADEARLRTSLEAAQQPVPGPAPVRGPGPPFGAPLPDYRNSLRDYDELFKGGPDPRMSSQTARPAMADLYAEIYAQYNKPKVKLGPRPKVSLDGKRPSGIAQSKISTLPAGMRISNRKPPEPKRPKSRDSSAVPSFAVPPPPPMSSLPIPPTFSQSASAPVTPEMQQSAFPPKSPISVKSMTLPAHGSHRPGGVSQEKQRLMKALELRKKQMKAKEAAKRMPGDVSKDEQVVGRNAKTGSVLTVGDPEPIIMDETPDQPEEEQQEEEQKPHKEEPSYVLPMLDLESVKDPVEPPSVCSLDKGDETDASHAAPDVPAPKVEEPQPAELQPPPPVEDSSVGVTSSVSESEDPHSASPTSSPVAQAQGSSPTPSTRPSSLSDDTSPPEQAPKPVAANTMSLTVPVTHLDTSPTDPEKESTRSSPTVVPESRTPVPVEITLQQPPAPEPPELLAPAQGAEGPLKSTNEVKTVGTAAPNGRDDGQAEKRSKPDSAIPSPTKEPPEADDVPGKQEKRESLQLNVPKRRSKAETKEKRGAMAESIHIHVTGDGSEEYMSDDSSFMEELQSAKVEEAKPVQVSKSPITPFFPRKPSVSESERPTSSASTISRIGRGTPEGSSVRKISAGWPPPTANREEKPFTKVNVSSGISQRIKALAEKSNKETSAIVSPLATPDASASSVTQRKSSFFSSLSPSDDSSRTSLHRLSRAASAKLSPTTTPDTTSASQFPINKHSPPICNFKRALEKPETVQVTARIVRDKPLKPSLTMPTENTPLDLHKSQITIDQVSVEPSLTPVPSTKTAPAKLEATSPKPPQGVKDQPSPQPRSSSESSWRAFGRRLSESKSPPPRSQSAHSVESTDERREDRKERKESKTSKLFKRMSSISSLSRKSSSKEDEASHEPTQLESVREPPPPVQVGDLNVQFPDTLVC